MRVCVCVSVGVSILLFKAILVIKLIETEGLGWKGYSELLIRIIELNLENRF